VSRVAGDPDEFYDRARALRGSERVGIHGPGLPVCAARFCEPTCALIGRFTLP
jgi:hypothetical protein